MFGLLRSLCTLVGFLVILGGGLFVFRDPLAATLISRGVESATGFPLDLGAAEVSAEWPPRIRLTDMTLRNPPGFREREALVVPHVSCRFSDGLWRGGKVSLDRLELVVSKIVVVKNASGDVNLAMLKGAQKTESPAKAESESPFTVRVLDLTLGRVYYYDFTASDDPRAMTFDLGIQNEVLENVTSPHQIQQLIIRRILRKTPLRIPGAAFDTLENLERAPGLQGLKNLIPFKK